MAEEKAESEKKSEGGGAKKTVLYAAVAGVLVVLILVGGIFLGSKFFGGEKASPDKGKNEKAAADEKGKGSHGEEGHAEPAAEEEEDEIVAKEVMVVVPLGELTFQLAGSTTRYGIIDVGLEVENEEAKAKLEKELMIPVRHEIRRLVTSYEFERLVSPAFQDSLPKLMKKNLKPYFKTIKLRNVYIQKLLFQ